MSSRSVAELLRPWFEPERVTIYPPRLRVCPSGKAAHNTQIVPQFPFDPFLIEVPIIIRAVSEGHGNSERFPPPLD